MPVAVEVREVRDLGPLAELLQRERGAANLQRVRAKPEAAFVDEHEELVHRLTQRHALDVAGREFDSRHGNGRRERGHDVRQAVVVQVRDGETVHPLAHVGEAGDVDALEKLPRARRIAHGVGIGELFEHGPAIDRRRRRERAPAAARCGLGVAVDCRVAR